MTSNNPHYEADRKAIEKKETSEGKEVIIRPRRLDIVWGNDTRYWRVPLPNQMDKPAELLQVCWLEVTSSIDLKVLNSLSIKKPQIGFKLSLSSDAFGWSGCPLYVMAKIGKKGKYTWRKVDLLADRGGEETFETPDNFCIELKDSPVDETLYFGLYEVWSGKWKGGLQIHHAFVREANK